MPELAAGSDDLGMGGKFDRYVSHILDSRSCKKSDGQPSASSSDSDSSVWPCNVVSPPLTLPMQSSRLSSALLSVSEAMAESAFEEAD